MSYIKALTAVGVEIYKYKFFGDYSGTAIALGTYNNKRKIFKFPFGSCTGCDEYLDWESNLTSEDGWRDVTQEELERFGKDFLEETVSYSGCYNKATEDSKWDIDSENIIKFLEENKEWLGENDGNF